MFFLLLQNVLTWLDIFVISLHFRPLKKILLCSWPLRFPGAEKRFITCMQAEIICLALDFNFFCFLHLWISPCSGTRIHHAHWDRSREGRTCRASSCSYKAPIFVPERSQARVHPSSLSRECMLFACPVLEDWASFSFCGDECVWRYAPHELPGGQDMLTNELQEECLLWPFCTYLLQTSWSLTLCCFSWDVVPSLKQTWVKWLGST